MNINNKTVRKRNVNTNSNIDNDTPALRYGPMPRFPNQRIWSRGIIIFGVLMYIWYMGKDGKEVILATYKDVVHNRGQSFECDEKYLNAIKNFPQCTPKKCGRFVTDKLITNIEANMLLNMGKLGFSLGGSAGGASILDIHSGAFSLGKEFVNIHSLPNSKKIFSPENLAIYKIITEKIQHAIAELFQIEEQSLYLTHPTFISKLTNDEPQTKNDEYWHAHVDKETYESFHYTSLLYLSSYGIDFKGGRFKFQDKNNLSSNNATVEPKLGRVLIFTSGAENLHSVEKVVSGVRYAVTVSFTCDPTHSIRLPDPKYESD